MPTTVLQEVSAATRVKQGAGLLIVLCSAWVSTAMARLGVYLVLRLALLVLIAQRKSCWVSQRSRGGKESGARSSGRSDTAHMESKVLWRSKQGCCR